MKKSKLILLLLAVIMALCVPLAACSKADYSLDRQEAALTVGETLQLNVTSSKDGEFTVVFSSDNEGVATVSESGLVTAVAAGEATVTAEVGGKQLTCAVTVNEVQYSYALNKTGATLEEEETLQLSVTSTPAKELSVSWSSSDESVATVSSSGLVTAVKEGSATIKATVDGKELTCAVTVEKAPVLYTYTLNQDSARLEKGTTTTLSLTCEPEREDGLTVVWSSKDDGIASVDEDGVVTAINPGDVQIEAIVDGEVKAICEVTVFEYVYSFEKNLTIDFGAEDAALNVTITPVKAIDISYEVGNENIVTIAANGKITTVGVGETTITVKDGGNVIGTCAVKVNYVLEFPEEIQLHNGDTYELEVKCYPENPDLNVTFAVTEGDAVTISGTTLTAVKDGNAKITATVGGETLECAVLVNDVNATSSMTKLVKDKQNPIDIVAGAEYWEQYIDNGEINHKLYADVQEDIIERISSHSGKYLSDYPAFLQWYGGADGATCDCGHCNKDTNNGGDGGWNGDAGTKAFCVDVKGAVVTLNIKVFAGTSTISVYTGGYNLKETVVLKSGGVVIASEEIDNRSAHNANLVEFEVNVTKATQITIELTFVDDYGDTGNSVMSLAAVSVSGSVYQLEKSSVRVIPDGTAQIVVNKDGEPVTEGITYEVEGNTIATVDENGLVTGLTVGEALVKVTVDGRVRYFTVDVGYTYSLNATGLQMHSGDSFLLEAVSDPAGSASEAVFEVAEGGDVVSVSDDGTVTALKDGEATVKVTVDGNELFCTVLVNGVNATVTMKSLTTSSVETLSGDGVAYWEQYINNEVNYKAIVSDEEDVIKREYLVGNTNYFSDYAKLIWTDGDSRCVKPSKPDGFSEGALLQIRQIGDNEVKAQLTVNVFAGKSTIKVYTGVFKGTNTVTLYNGEVAIASYELRSDNDHIRNLVTFEVDVAEDTEIKIVLALTNTTSDNSFLTLVAASVSCSTYQLEKTSARIIPDGTTQIVLYKDGDVVTEGVTYEVEGNTIASVDANGLVTGLSVGEAIIKVTCDGRVRYFTVEVGYTYSLKEDKIVIKKGDTYQIEVISDPVGAEIEAAYASSNTAVATVDGNGLVTAVANGTAEITVNVDGNEFVLAVSVAGVEVTTRYADTAGTVVDLTSGEIIYWEHYLYNELNPMDISDGGRDLIEGGLEGKNGDANSTVKFYFAGSSGPKENSLDDGAFHKYSWSSGFEFDITVPVGTYEIRVYTGVWESTNKTSLSDGDVEVGSYEFGVTSNGINKLVAFTVTTDTEKVLTLKIEALSGTNCRLNAIAIADMSLASELSLAKTVNTVDGNTIDFTAEGILDWATFGADKYEKEGGELILTDTLSQGSGAGNASDYKGSFNLGEQTVSNFSFSNQYVSVQVKVTADVKKIALYVTGWSADYFVAVADQNGVVVSSEFVSYVNSQSVAKELLFDVDVTEEQTITVITRKLSNSNCGIAGIALYGEQA